MKQINIKEIKEITLLSEREAKKVDIDIRATVDRWWLRSSYLSSSILVCYVGNYGYTYGYISHEYVNRLDFGVRPALRINNLKSYRLSKNARVECLGKTWIKIGVDDLILMEDILFPHRFDPKSNDFDKSEIKQIINDWLVARKAEAIMKEYNVNSLEEIEQRLVEYGAVE